MSDGDLTPRPLNIRKQRQSDMTTPTHRYNHENGLAVSLLPATSRKTSTGRIVTANKADRQRAAYTQGESTLDLRRQPSFKHRLLNRMMSGLTTRTQINGIDELNESTVQKPSTARVSRDASCSSTASSDLNTYDLKDLDRALAAFPTPPTSNVTSPTTNGSSETSELHPQTYKDLCVPRQDAALAAELRIIPCPSQLNANRGLLVAVEISTTSHHGLIDYELQPPQSAVNVVVIIDNSLYNSPASLMASCEIAGLLASFLDTSSDRLAVFCTMPADADERTSGPTIILPLSPISLRRLKAKLDNVTSSVAQPARGVMTAALKEAQQILKTSGQLVQTGKAAHDTFGHIFVFTADMSALDGENLSHPTFQTHILCSGFPKQTKWDEIACNGWKMPIFGAFLSKDHPPRLGPKRDRDPHNLSNRLQTLIRFARLGKLANFLTDLVLDVMPRSGFSIEKTMGRSNYSELRPGEVKTIIVRLLPAGCLDSLDRIDSLRWRNFSAFPSGEDLIAELDRMLGLPKDGMMTAKVRYKHSSLPVNTTCVTTAKCLLRTPLPPPLKDENVAYRPTATKAKTLFDQRLAEYYATYYEPRDALFSLHQEFGEGGCRSACPVYVTAVADELRYQARISERIAIENSPQRVSDRYEKPHPGTRVEDLSMPAFQFKDSNSGESISVQNGDIFAPRLSPTKLAEQLGLDDARKIWNDLRNASRGDKSGSVRKGSVSHAPDRENKGTKSGLKTERSIGEASLRSLSMPIKASSRSGLSAPWL